MTTLPMPGGLFGGGLLSPDQRKQALGFGLLSAGGQMMQGGQPGLLGSLGQGLQGFAGGYQNFADRARQDKLYDLQLRGLEREDRAAELSEERREQMADAVNKYLEGNGLPPEVDSIVRTKYNAGDYDGALQTASDYVMDQMKGGEAPKTVGGMMWDGSQFVPIPGYTDQASAIAAAGRAPAAPRQPIQVYDPATKTMVWKDPSQAIGMQASAPDAPSTTGGMMWDPTTGSYLPIPGYVDQQSAIAAAGRPTVNIGPDGIDYGEPEAGLAWARNPDGTVRLDDRGAPIAIPYQGGKRFQELQAAEQAGAEKTQQTVQAGNVVLSDINRAREKIEGATLPTTGTFGPALSRIGGTAAADVKALLDTVRANIGFDRLQAMRDSSPTGGALGQITERELAFLQATMGSLDQAQTQKQLLQNLDRLEQIYTGILQKAAAYPNAAQFGFGGDPTPASADNPYSSMSDEEILQKLREEGYLE